MQTILTNNLLSIDSKRNKAIDIQEIIMLKGYSNYTYFYLKNGKYLLTPRTLKYYESELEAKGFLRVHRGFLVNQACIIRHDMANAQLTLINGYEVDIARRRKNYIQALRNGK